jgi:hypothetical protein
VKLLVTRGFGARPLASPARVRVAGAETVMSLLMRNLHVETRFGGGFVESIAGASGGSQNGRPVDWFYYVNGVEATVGAAANSVHPGDHVWWDLHDWSQTESIPAVVGSFPEPFLNGLAGKRLPVRVECGAGAGVPCQRVYHRLAALGVPAALAAPGAGVGGQTIRLLVGPWSQLERDPTVGPIAAGPRASGVYVRFASGGGRLSLLDGDGRTTRFLAAGAGLVAATRREEEAPAWVVTGTDETGVERAAALFDAASLDGRFAVAATAHGPVAVPTAGSG